MASKILIALALIVVVVLGLVIMQPDEYSISRSIEIEAPAEKIFPHINDLKQFTQWNPWSKMDPEMKIMHEGAPEGVGASYSWSGNSQDGSREELIDPALLYYGNL